MTHDKENLTPAEPEPESWREIGSGPPPAGWPTTDDGAPYLRVTTYERGPFGELAVISGDGRASSPYCLVVSEKSGALPCWRTVQSALDALCLKGAMFTLWSVAGYPAPDVWRLRQVGAVGDTPAAFRFQLSTPGRRIISPDGGKRP